MNVPAPSNLIPVSADPMTGQLLMPNTECSALRSDYVKVTIIYIKRVGKV